MKPQGKLWEVQKEARLHVDTLVEDYRASRNKDFFQPIGTRLYVGEQGSGKTAGSVHHVLFKWKPRYPRAILVSNLKLTHYDALTFGSKEELDAVLRHINPKKQYIYFESMDELAIALIGVNNGIYGVIYLIDEIHSYLNAKDSKNIPMYVFSEISQQRKQRKAVVGTSQLFMRAAIALREQCMYVIACNTFLGVWTRTRVYKGSDIEDFYSSKAMKGGKTLHTLKTGWFMHSKELRESYDTFQKISSGLDMLDLHQNISVTIMQKRTKFGR